MWPQVRRHPYIHAVATMMVISGLNLFLNQDAVPAGQTSISIVAGGAILSASAILIGMHWREPFMARAIEQAGQYLSAAVWVFNLIIVWRLTGLTATVTTPILAGAGTVVGIPTALFLIGRFWPRVRRLCQIVAAIFVILVILVFGALASQLVGPLVLAAAALTRAYMLRGNSKRNLSVIDTAATVVALSDTSSKRTSR